MDTNRMVLSTPLTILRRIRHRRKSTGESVIPPDIAPDTRRIINAVRPYTMTSPERISSLIEAIRYIVRNKIPGDIVECGVWKGGSMLAAAIALKEIGDTSRNLYLFDTFSGMTEPEDVDKDFRGSLARDLMDSGEKTSSRVWAYSTLDEVKHNMAKSGYPDNNIKFCIGNVEDTLPEQAPPQISLLRLDTDWYHSTRHELVHLWPRVVRGGIVIIDDYGHWAGARKAVDEYIEENNIPVLLHRIDYTGRICVKP